MSWHEPGKDGYRKPEKKSRFKQIFIILVLIVIGATLEVAYDDMIHTTTPEKNNETVG